MSLFPFSAVRCPTVGIAIVMTENHHQFIEFALQANVLRFGEFKTKAGRLSPYFFNAGLFNTGALLDKLGHFYAQALLAAKKAGRVDFDMIYGPAYKGIPIAVSVAVALAKDGLDVPFFFNRKEEKDHGEGGVFVGYKPQAGEDVVIVEDVITAGTAIRESMAILSKLDGVNVKATFVMVDRKEKGQGEKSAMAEVTDEFGFPVYSVVDVYDIIEYLEKDEANKENVDRIKAYLAVNGATE